MGGRGILKSMRSSATTEEHAHADRHGDDQDQIRDGGNLFCENLQVRLRYGDDKAQDEAHENHDP